MMTEGLWLLLVFVLAVNAAAGIIALIALLRNQHKGKGSPSP